MVLSLPLDDWYRESILGFTGQNPLAGARVSHMSRILVSTGFSVLPGFAPAGEALLFWQKDPKPVTPLLASLGADGRQSLEDGPTRFAQTRSVN